MIEWTTDDTDNTDKYISDLYLSVLSMSSVGHSFFTPWGRAHGESHRNPSLPDLCPWLPDDQCPGLRLCPADSLAGHHAGRGLRAGLGRHDGAGGPGRPPGRGAVLAAVPLRVCPLRA